MRGLAALARMPANERGAMFAGMIGGVLIGLYIGFFAGIAAPMTPTERCIEDALRKGDKEQMQMCREAEAMNNIEPGG